MRAGFTTRGLPRAVGDVDARGGYAAIPVLNFTSLLWLRSNYKRNKNASLLLEVALDMAVA